MHTQTRAALAALFATLALADGLAQQKYDNMVPLELKTSKSVFLSYAGVDQNSTEQKANSYSNGANWLYAECFQNLSTKSQFQLQRQPSDADLILEVLLEDRTQPTTFTYESSIDPRLRLRVLDRKTGVLLWTFFKHVELSRKEADRDRNLKKAVSDLVADLTALTQPAQNP